MLPRTARHELPLVHTSEMTLDYCFFCHDKKHFFVVKGHFCSFLISSIYWLTSLSVVLMRFGEYFRFHSFCVIAYFFILTEDLCLSASLAQFSFCDLEVLPVHRYHLFVSIRYHKKMIFSRHNIIQSNECVIVQNTDLRHTKTNPD